jgi:hypothetical protein
VTTLAASTRRAARGPLVASAAHLGLATRGVLYLVIAWLAGSIALGHTRQQANQKGAIATLAGHRGGSVTLWILGLGLAAYSFWRLTEAVVGTAAEGRKLGPRVQSLVRALSYAAFAVIAFQFVLGAHGQGQDQQQQSATARLIRHPSGRLLVGAIGVVVVAIGLWMIADGLRKRFVRELRVQELPRSTRELVIVLGVVGNTARGAVFALAGWLALDAAMTSHPDKSAGLDGALRTLANRPYGPLLLLAVAAGLFAFGLYGLAAARWAKVQPR